MEAVKSLLIVTRERADDRRFGLGRSLDPVVAELRRRRVRVTYLSQADAGARSLAWLQRWQPWLARWLKRRFPGTDAEALAGGMLERLNMGRLAAKAAFRDGISHVHCHDPIITAGFQWWRWWYGGLRAHQVRHGLTQHGFGSYTQALHEDGAPLDAGAMAWLRHWEARILRRADWVVTPTQAGRAQLARDLGVYPLPAHWQVVPHPRPSLSFPPRNEARAQLEWDPDWFVVLGVGRDAPLKRFVDLIHACARVNDERLRLVLLGPGESAALRRIAAEAGLGARLILAASWAPAVYYAAADVYVSASETESFGLANVEALAVGLPAIVTAVGGVPEVVGNAAWLVPPRQPVLIADAITCLLRSTEERCAWSERARARMQQWPDAAAVAEGYLQVYRGAPVPPALGRQLPLEIPVRKPLSVYPLPRRLEITARRLLVFAPHPDDETLGVGGLLAATCAAGGEVRVVVVTRGEAGDPEGRFDEPTPCVRREELRCALAALGVEDLVQWREPDGDCRDHPGLRRRIRQMIDSFGPDWILAPSILERHRDHVAVAEAVICAWQASATEAELFLYEVSQPVAATHVVDVTPWQDRKRKALSVYRLPLAYCDYETVSRSLMAYRAHCLAPGAKAVEALQRVDRTQGLRLLAAMRRLREAME